MGCWTGYRRLCRRFLWRWIIHREEEGNSIGGEEGGVGQLGHPRTTIATDCNFQNYQCTPLGSLQHICPVLRCKIEYCRPGGGYSGTYPRDCTPIERGVSKQAQQLFDEVACDVPRASLMQ